MAKKPTQTKTSSGRRRLPGLPPSPTELELGLVAAGDRTTAYALDVLKGAVIAGPHVRNACRRHLQDLVDGPARGLTWDLPAAHHVWRFFERGLRLSEGQFEGIPFLLQPSQAFKLGSIFGWKWTATGRRRFRRAYIEEGKGNGKSPFAGGIGLYMMIADGESGAQIYSIGALKEQAQILFRDAVKMVRQSRLLESRLTFSGGEGREYNISHRPSGSFFRPLTKSAGKTGSGPRPHCGLADELHEHPDRKAVEMIERGFKFREQPLLLMITNSGWDLKSYCREEHDHAVKVAAGTRTPDKAFAYVGEVIDDTTFAYVCALDEGDDPINDPSCWPKTNPLLGVILKVEDLERVVKQARDMPGTLNGILRLHFCVWTESDTAWISRETLEKVLADFDPAEHFGKKVSLGVDLSRTKDLTAVAHCVHTGFVERLVDGQVCLRPTYDVWIEAWTPAATLLARAHADQAPYDIWVKERFLRTSPGTQVSFDQVAAYLAKVDVDFDVRVLAYDRYAYFDFSKSLDAFGLQLVEAEHPQGGRRKAKPTEEQLAWAKARHVEPPEGLWMPGSLEKLEDLILDGRVRLKRNPVLISACMSAAINDKDPFGNRWFEKKKATQRIDPLISTTMSVGAALAEGFDRIDLGALIDAGGGVR